MFDRLKIEKMALTLEQKGVRAGDRIALLHPPCDEVIALFLPLGKSAHPFVQSALAFRLRNLKSIWTDFSHSFSSNLFPSKPLSFRLLIRFLTLQS